MDEEAVVLSAVAPEPERALGRFFYLCLVILLSRFSTISDLCNKKSGKRVADKELIGKFQ